MPNCPAPYDDIRQKELQAVYFSEPTLSPWQESRDLRQNFSPGLLVCLLAVTKDLEFRWRNLSCCLFLRWVYMVERLSHFASSSNIHLWPECFCNIHPARLKSNLTGIIFVTNRPLICWASWPSKWLAIRGELDSNFPILPSSLGSAGGHCTVATSISMTLFLIND